VSRKIFGDIGDLHTFAYIVYLIVFTKDLRYYVPLSDMGQNSILFFDNSRISKKIKLRSVYMYSFEISFPTYVQWRKNLHLKVNELQIFCQTSIKSVFKEITCLQKKKKPLRQTFQSIGRHIGYSLFKGTVLRDWNRLKVVGIDF
jgi:hypothetical protein